MPADGIRSASRDTARIMNRSELTRRLVAKLNKQEAVIGGVGHTNFDLWASGQRPQNFYMLGSMGLAVPIAFGVALAQPQRQVFALEGDGSLLMQLGALGTIAMFAPKNLAIVIFDNGVYQITGSQPTLTSYGTDLVAMAKGAGLAQSAWVEDEAHYEELIQLALNGGGPWFIAARTDDQLPTGVTARDAAKFRSGFMQGLGVSA